MTKRVLLLAGTREARELAISLAGDESWHVIASLAGVTDAPAQLPVETRTGGFGGTDGLADYLRNDRIEAVIDATHPFAAQMTNNAVAACRRSSVPLLRVERAPWTPPQDANWIRVATLEAAAQTLPAGARAFLTVGANSLVPFSHRQDVWFLVRTMDAPSAAPLAQCEMIVGAPPADSREDARLMCKHRITHLVTKNAGGTAYAKLEAAADLSIPTIMVDRPPAPDVDCVSVVADAVKWLRHLAATS